MSAVLPPSDAENGSLHILQPKDGFPSNFRWLDGRWCDEFHPIAGGATPEDMGALGFVYIRPSKSGGA